MTEQLESHLDQQTQQVSVDLFASEPTVVDAPKADKSFSFERGYKDGIAAFEHAVKIGGVNPIRPRAPHHVTIPWTTDPELLALADKLFKVLKNGFELVMSDDQPLIDAEQYHSGYKLAWCEAGREQGAKGLPLWSWVDLPAAPVAEAGSVFGEVLENNRYDPRRWVGPTDPPEGQLERIRLERNTFRHQAACEVYEEEYWLFKALAYGHALGLNDAKRNDEMIARGGVSVGTPEERPEEARLVSYGGRMFADDVVKLVTIPGMNVSIETHIGLLFNEYVEPENRQQYTEFCLGNPYGLPRNPVLLSIECPVTKERVTYASVKDTPLVDVPCSCGKPGCFYVKWTDKPAETTPVEPINS
jgi:hypothetical protein